MEKGWLWERTWRAIRARVPVTCADVLPVRTGSAGSKQIGLIYRETPHQGRRWCLIGGRILRNEPFRAAVERQVCSTLGPAVRCGLKTKRDDLHAQPQPLFVAEYFSRPRRGALFDPRQHAVALIFSTQIQGRIQPMGEALDFRWFDIRQLPSPAAVGFDQHKIVAECIRRLAL